MRKPANDESRFKVDSPGSGTAGRDAQLFHGVYLPRIWPGVARRPSRCQGEVFLAA